MNSNDKKIIELANNFSRVLNNWIPEKLFEVNLRNKEKSYIEGGFCATHDFCDANQAMIDAFISIYGREPSTKNKKDNLLINKAWSLSKIAEFKLIDLNGGNNSKYYDKETGKLKFYDKAS